MRMTPVFLAMYGSCPCLRIEQYSQLSISAAAAAAVAAVVPGTIFVSGVDSTPAIDFREYQTEVQTRWVYVSPSSDYTVDACYDTDAPIVFLDELNIAPKI